jgi:bidirectional [NiFe] hydrogenase diaphorase subunit
MNSDELENVAEIENAAQASYRHHVRVCTAAACLSQGSDKVKESLDKEVERRGLARDVQVKCVGCMGLCSEGPLVSVDEKGLMYQNIVAADASDVIGSLDAAPVERLICKTNVPFFTRQTRIVSEYCGVIDPERIEEYIAAGGYQSLQKVLVEMDPPDVVEQVTKSGLRGRGGAGFPTGLNCRQSSKQRRPQVCHLQRR